MQAWYPQAFEREMGCSREELVRWLPGACGGRPLEVRTDSAEIVVGVGTMRLEWRSLPPRQIGLLRTPRLGVKFSFEQVDELTRQQVMRYFDLYTQRGGG